MSSDFNDTAAIPSGNADTLASRPLIRLPHLPAKLLKRHGCFIGTDTRFRAAARLLQSLHREAAGIPVGLHTSISGTKRRRLRLGSRLPLAAASTGRNFVSADVFRLVRRELVLREEGAAIDEDRLFGNLLSSMPLTFNLLGPLALDLDLATTVFRSLLPAFVHAVTAIGFETSPGRGRPEYLNDGTAFDAALHIVTPDGEPGLVFVEMKYSEGMSGPAAAPRPRYDAASRQVRLYRDSDSPVLRSIALEQLWREHMLAQLAVDLEFTPKAHFVAIGPRLNRQASAAFKAYADQLAEPEAEDPSAVGFTPLTLEAVVDALAAAGATDTAALLRQRYLDFGRILDLALAEADGCISPILPPRPAPSSQRARPLKPGAEAPEKVPLDRVTPLQRSRERRPASAVSRRSASSKSAAPAAGHRTAT